MPRDLKEELRKTRKELTACMAETMPSKEFGATIIMAVVGLHLIEARIRKSQNLEERRQSIDEFNWGKAIIEKGIRALGKTRSADPNSSEEQFHNAMPRLW